MIAVVTFRQFIYCLFVCQLVHGGKGSQFVTVTVEVPKKLNNRQKELLRELESLESTSQHPKQKSFFDKVRDAFK